MNFTAPDYPYLIDHVLVIANFVVLPSDVTKLMDILRSEILKRFDYKIAYDPKGAVLSRSRILVGRKQKSEKDR